MNQELTLSIIKHIYSNFGIIPSHFVDLDKTQSLKSAKYLLDKKLKFEDSTGKIWGCKLKSGDQDISIILGECGEEYALIIYPNNLPAYGLYLDFDFPNIACSTNKNWFKCNIYLQSLLLGAMEQIKELGFSVSKLENYDEGYQLLTSFIGHSND